MLKQICLLVALCMLPFAGVQATAFDASYLQAGYIIDGSVSQNGFNVANDDFGYEGWQIQARLGISKHLYLLGEYNNLQSDQAGHPSSSYYHVGIGLQKSLNEEKTIHLFGQATYESIDIDQADGDGFGLGGGLRWQLLDDFHLSAHIGYVQYRGADALGPQLDGVRYGAQAVYQIVQPAAIFLSYQATKLNANGDSTFANFDIKHQVTMGLRFYFARL